MNTITATRYAVVSGRGTRRAVEAYLPSSYIVTASHEANGNVVALLEGTDDVGWTLEGYVLPRLASGLYYGREFDSVDAAYFVVSVARALSNQA